MVNIGAPSFSTGPFGGYHGAFCMSHESYPLHPPLCQRQQVLTLVRPWFFAACNGTIIQDKDMGEVIQLQGDHRTKVMDFLTDKDKDKMGKYALDKANIKVSHRFFR